MELFINKNNYFYFYEEKVNKNINDLIISKEKIKIKKQKIIKNEFTTDYFSIRCGFFKDIIINTKLKIKKIDIIIGGVIIETIDYKFLKIYNYLLNKKNKSFKNYLYEYYFDFEKNIIIPSFIFNYGLIRLDFHFINLNITLNDNIINENDIEIYVNHYNIDVYTYINYCSLTYDIPYKEIVKVNKIFEETIALIFETPKPNSIKIKNNINEVDIIFYSE